MVRRVAKTSRYSPSLRSPKSRARIVAARAESVPGTPKSLDKSALSRVDAKPPAISKTSQATSTVRRKRSAQRVMRASNGSSSGRSAVRPSARARLRPTAIRRQGQTEAGTGG